MKLNYVQKKVLGLLANKRGQMPSTIERKLGNLHFLAHPVLSYLVGKGLVKRKQILKKATPKRRAKRVTKYFITEKGLYQL